MEASAVAVNFEVSQERSNVVEWFLAFMGMIHGNLDVLKVISDASWSFFSKTNTSCKSTNTY